jgi:hypothetical protein
MPMAASVLFKQEKFREPFLHQEPFLRLRKIPGFGGCHEWHTGSR